MITGLALLATGTAVATFVIGAYFLFGPDPQLSRIAGIKGRRRLTLPSFAPVRRWTERLAEIGAARLTERQRRHLNQRLDEAGRPGRMTLRQYVEWKIVLTSAGILAALALSGGERILVFIWLFVGWKGLDWFLIARARSRREAIEGQVADYIDILSVSVAAGIAFDVALRRVALEGGGVLGEEILRTLHRMQMGIYRAVAFDEMRKRTKSPSLGHFVAALTQADTLGTPVTETLEGLALDIRRRDHQEARRRAARAAPRISGIVALLITPAAAALMATALFLSASVNLGAILG